MAETKEETSGKPSPNIETVALSKIVGVDTGPEESGTGLETGNDEPPPAETVAADEATDKYGRTFDPAIHKHKDGVPWKTTGGNLIALKKPKGRRRKRRPEKSVQTAPPPPSTVGGVDVPPAAATAEPETSAVEAPAPSGDDDADEIEAAANDDDQGADVKPWNRTPDENREKRRARSARYAVKLAERISRMISGEGLEVNADDAIDEPADLYIDTYDTMEYYDKIPDFNPAWFLGLTVLAILGRAVSTDTAKKRIAATGKIANKVTTGGAGWFSRFLGRNKKKKPDDVPSKD